LVARDHDRHVWVADGQEVLLQENEAVRRDGEDDDQRHHRPDDLQTVVTVDLRRHVPGGLFGSAVTEQDPEQGELDADEYDDRRDRDDLVQVVDVLAVGRDGCREDGGDAAQPFARVEQECRCNKAEDCERQSAALVHGDQV
jgi:hypothetical protein